MRIQHVFRIAILVAVSAIPAAHAAEPAASDASFGFSLLRQLVADHAGGNVIVAPRNIRTALAAVTTGASGETHDGIVALAGDYPSIDNRPTDVARSALLIWVAPTGRLNPRFVDGLHGADVESTPPAIAAQTINRYVAQHTDGMIDKVIDHIPDGAGIVLTTALAFDGKWQTPFDADLTRPQVFESATGGSEQVPFMQRNGTFDYAENGAGQIIQLPYASSDDVCLTIFLPARGTSIDTWLAGMNDAKWTALLQEIQSDRQGDLQLPKLKSGFSASLKDALTKMGMGLAFSDAADFDRILIGQRLRIADVQHVTAIDIDEKGTKAAAATTVPMMATAMPMRQQERFSMVVDRPYFFTIGDAANQRILFAGVVRRP